MINYDSLDDLQRQAVEEISYSQDRIAWIRGYAGSGKTIILLHIIKRFLIDNPHGTVCFVTFTNALKELAYTGLTNAERGKITITTSCQFKSSCTRYDLVIIDEVQDCYFSDIQNASSRFNYKLIIAGDASQQIYTKRIKNNEIVNFFDNKIEEAELRIVHRLTDKIKRIATSILPTSKIVGSETPAQQSSLKRGADAYLYKAASELDEVKGILLNIKENPPKVSYPYAILLPNHDSIKRFIKLYIKLEGWQSNISASEANNEDYYGEFNRGSGLLKFFGNGIGSLNDSDNNPIVYIMTYHSAKGFDFEKVYIPFLDIGCFDPILRLEGEDIPDIDRKVLYVAVTRSKNDLILSYHTDKPHPYIKELVEKNLIIKADMPTTPLFDDDDDDF